MSYRVQHLHMTYRRLEVDVRFVRLNGRWIASADTPAGPTLGWGRTAFAAVWVALAPFQGAVADLLASVPEEALPE